MKITSLLDPKLIKCGLAANTKDEALDEIVQVMVAGTPGVTSEGLRASLTEREKLGPFSMAKGSAFPHARTEKVSDFRIALGTSPEGIDFRAPDGNSIRLIVLFVIPKKHSNLYLHTLAQFLNLFGAEEHLRLAVGARSGEELIAALETIPARPAAGSASEPPPSVTVDTTLSRAVELLSTRRLEALAVVDAEGNLVGELSALALLQLGTREDSLHLPSTGQDRPGDPVQSALRVHADTPLERLGVISTNGYRAVQEDESPAEIALMLSRAGARAAYVLRGKRLVGRVTVSEILKRASGGK